MRSISVVVVFFLFVCFLLGFFFVCFFSYFGKFYMLSENSCVILNVRMNY